MAVANGIDPASKTTVPCNFWNETFASSLYAAPHPPSRAVFGYPPALF